MAPWVAMVTTLVQLATVVRVSLLVLVVPMLTPTPTGSQRRHQQGGSSGSSYPPGQLVPQMAPPGQLLPVTPPGLMNSAPSSGPPPGPAYNMTGEAFDGEDMNVPEGEVEPDPSLGPRTTVMLRNLPNQYTREMLLDLLDNQGFLAEYDFIYLPIDFGSKSGFGYAFINLINEAVAIRFRERFQGFSAWAMESTMVADVTWSSTHQGLEQHVNRYRNSPVMHETMPDECKPMILVNGVRAEFPPPTKSLRPPRIRPSKIRPTL